MLNAIKQEGRVLSFIQVQKVTIKIFLKRHRNFVMMTFVSENFFCLFSTDWNFYDVVIDTPVFKNVAIWKYIYNIYIFSCLIKRDMYVGCFQFPGKKGLH